MTAINNRSESSTIFSVRDILRRRFSKKNKITNNVLIKSASDNLGNTILSTKNLMASSLYCRTYDTLSVGDTVEFEVVTANNEEEMLEYSLDIDYKNIINWQQSNLLKVKILEKYISKFCQIRINVRKIRSYQTIKETDNSLIFSYQIKL